MKDPSFLATYGIKVNVPLSSYTALAVGGNADFFVAAQRRRAFVEILDQAAANGLKVIVIGGGTNIVFSDFGFRGLVIKSELTDLHAVKNLARVGSGMTMTDLVHSLAKEGYGGFEALAAVPGTVGGAIWNNAGTDDLTVADVLQSVTVYSKGRVIELPLEDLHFDYRDSRLKHGAEWILAAKFRCAQKEPNAVKQAILAATQQRLKSQPHGRHAARIFRDPLPQRASELAATVGMAGERVGDAVVSTKNANYIINRGQATASDVYQLAQRIKDRVKVKLDVKLVEEVHWAGEW